MAAARGWRRLETPVGTVRAFGPHGPRPIGYVLENIVLHVVNTTLVYALVFHLVGRIWPAAVAGALFSVHPVTTEAVTNIVGRAGRILRQGAGSCSLRRSSSST
jgi:hypothetical protein